MDRDKAQRREFNETAYNSKKLTWMWNLDILHRIDKELLQKKAGRLHRKGVNNIVQLLRRIGLQDDYLPATLIGFYQMRPRHRESLEDLFDDSHVERKQLEGKIQGLRKDIRILGQEKQKDFFEWEETAAQIKSMRDLLKEAETAFSVIPKRNSIPVNLYSQPTLTTLKKKNRVKVRGDNCHEMAESWMQAYRDCRAMSRAFVTEGSEPSEEILLGLWSEVRQRLGGNHPTKGLLQRLTERGKLLIGGRDEEN